MRGKLSPSLGGFSLRRRHQGRKAIGDMPRWQNPGDFGKVSAHRGEERPVSDPQQSDMATSASQLSSPTLSGQTRHLTRLRGVLVARACWPALLSGASSSR